MPSAGAEVAERKLDATIGKGVCENKALLREADFEHGCSNRLRKKPRDRLLTRAAQKRHTHSKEFPSRDRKGVGYKIVFSATC